MNSASANKRIAVLDGLRALAILAVLAFHFTVRWAPPRDPAAHFPPGGTFSGVIPLNYGWMGVELFFVISGFVILMTLERCETILDFARRRLARLWPALIVSAVITTIVVNLLGPSDWHVGPWDLSGSLILIDPATIGTLGRHPGGHWVDGAYWSLAVEIRFYAITSLIFFASARDRLKKLVIFYTTLITIATFRYFSDSTPAVVVTFCNLLFAEYAPYFLLGFCCYGIHRGSLDRRIYALGIGFSSAALGAWSMATVGIFTGYSGTACLAINGAIVAIFLLFLANSALLLPFASKPMVALGRASYSLYLLHQSIGIVLMTLAIGWGLPYLLALALVTLLLIAAALTMARIVEEPGRAWILRHTGRPFQIGQGT